MEHLLGRPPADADRVRERWRTQSLETVWLRPGDWYHPSVDALAEAIVDRRPTAPAAERLGRARGESGVSIGEAIDDVGCLFQAVGEEPDLATLRAVSTGWVEGTEAHPPSVDLTDPASGLATAQYLKVRLKETYSHGRRTGAPAHESHCLLMVDVALDQVAIWQAAAREAGVGSALIEACGDGHPMAALGGGRYAVLCERGDDASDLLVTVRHRIEQVATRCGITTILRRPPRVWIEPLPAAHLTATMLLDQLRR